MAKAKTAKAKAKPAPDSYEDPLPMLDAHKKAWDVSARLSIEQQMCSLHAMLQGAQTLEGAPPELEAAISALSTAWNIVNKLPAPYPPANPYYF